jgi:3-oxoacyl-[acyl-carrier protein] reductase
VKVALVTGSSRGIGRAIAERLALDGAAVVVHYATRAESADEVVAGIAARGGRAIALGADVSDPSAVSGLFDAIEGRLGPVDVLVNNAGIHRGGRIQRLRDDDFEQVLRTTVFGSFHCTQRAIAGMVERGWGRIVNVSSVVARRGSPGDVVYSTAKAGLLGMTRSLAAELARSGVTVNAVLPGLVWTEMTGGLSDKAKARVNSSVPMGRPAEPEEVAAAVAYLASDAAGYVTGVELPVDGGFLT